MIDHHFEAVGETIRAPPLVDLCAISVGHSRLDRSLLRADIWSVERVQERASHPGRLHARDRLERLQSVFKFVPVRFRCHIS